ncbi:hypothetical protein [Polaromonas sp. CG9_12]|nr:hypothetical protein [Polaromonas sp. CG9_12]
MQALLDDFETVCTPVYGLLKRNPLDWQSMHLKNQHYLLLN